MFTKTRLKKHLRKAAALLLILSVMVSLAVPFDLSVFAADTSKASTGDEVIPTAEDSQIWAMLYIKDKNKNTNTDRKFGSYQTYENLELVFQKGEVADPSKILVAKFSNFAGTCYHYRQIKNEIRHNYGSDNKAGYKNSSGNQVYCPWYSVNVTNGGSTISNITREGQNIVKVNFKDKIQPTYTASWFYNLKKLTEIANIENLDTSACKNMSFMFYRTNSMTSLDLSSFDVRKVEAIDYFIVSDSDSSQLTSIKIAGDNWKLDSALNLKGFIYNCFALEDLDISGLDVSKIEVINNFINGCKNLETIDASSINPRSVHDFTYGFSSNYKLKTLIFGTFEPGVDNHIYPLVRMNGFLQSDIALETVDFANWNIPAQRYSTDSSGNNLQWRTTRIEYQGFFKDCKSLKKLTKEEHFDKMLCPEAESGTWMQREMFLGCESLEEVDLSSIKAYIGGISIFKGCTNLKKINLAQMGILYNSGDNNNYIDWHRQYGFNSYDTKDITTTSKQTWRYNIYEGCENLSEFTFSEWYIPQDVKYYKGSKTGEIAYPDTLFYYPKTFKVNNVSYNYEFVGELNPDIPPIDMDRLWVKTRHPDAGTCSIADGDLVPVGTTLKASELFTDFQRTYAGTWVTEAKVVLDAKGGSPAQQTFSGAVDLVASGYDPDEIEKPTKNGYQFDDWYAKYYTTETVDEEEVEVEHEEKLDPTKTVKAWTYYAKWNENHYKFKLNGNGGTTAAVATETEGKYETSDGKEVTETKGSGDDIKAVEFIANGNIGYDDFYELNSRIFAREGYVLSGWNTRPNGEGEEFSANDSVNMLTETDKGEATLYAQWYKPDVVVSFDSQGGSAVADRNYTLSNDPENPTKYGILAESSKEGYTFLGWYTAADGGKKVVTKTGNLAADEIRDVDGAYTTLYAHWAVNPTITFDAGGDKIDNTDPAEYTAYFEGDTKKNVVTKYYQYGDYLGLTPTPKCGSAVLVGWFDENGVNITSASLNGGISINSPSEKKVTESTTYYAHWGYKPQFESNGGVYKTFPSYSTKTKTEAQSYEITALPEFTNETDFLGWYYNGTNISEALANSGTGKITLNLTTGDVIEARWKTITPYVVTLDTQGGSLKTGAINPINVNPGKTVGELPTPAKSDSEFLGWFTEASGGDKKDYTFTPTGDCTLYAQWAEKTLTVNFDPNGGTLYYDTDASKTVKSGGKISALPGANRSDSTTNYTFDGWYTNADGTGDKLSTSTAITTEMTTDGEITYYAKWTPVGEKFTSSSDNLYSYTVRWNTPSNNYVTNIDDRLVVAPPTGDSELSVMLFIQFDFNQLVSSTQQKTLPAESVKIVIPQKIFKDSSGNGVGYDNIGTGLYKDDTPDCAFIYDDEDTDYPGCYVIKNNEEIKEGVNQNQMFRITYSISPSDLRKMNGGYVDENGNFAGAYFDENVPVKIIVDENKDNTIDKENGDTDYTKNLALEVHTKVVASPTKTRADASYTWNTDWGVEPADADQYFYVKWTLRAIFDGNNNQQFKYSWDESTVHDGSVVKILYPDGYSADKYYSSGTFNTTVITKHTRNPKDSGWKDVYNEAILNVEWLSGHKTQYRVSETAGIYLLPDGDRVVEKYIHNYKYSAKRFRKGDQDTILSRTAVRNLIFDLEYQEYKNLDSPTWYSDTKTYSAPEREIIITDGRKGDLVMSTVKGPDKYNWNCSSNQSLSDSDYSFDSLTVYLTEYDAVQVSYTEDETTKTDWSEPFVHNQYKDYGDVEIWTRAEGEDSFILYKTMKISEFQEMTDDPDTEKIDESEWGIISSTIDLPANTVGYQVKHKSTFFTTKLIVNGNMSLKSSNKVRSFVKEDVANGVNTLIKNNCNFTVNVGSTKKLDEESKDDKSGGASICSYELGMDESYVYADKNIANANYTKTEGSMESSPTVIAGWNYLDTATSNVKLVESGVFNDLLPYNTTVDKSSIFVQYRTTNTQSRNIDGYQYNAQNTEKQYQSLKIPSSYYSVKFTDNWENSGRTMMTITINTPDDIRATGYNVFYKMKTTLANVSANGLTQTNYVSFTDTTEDQSLPVGKINSISGTDKNFERYYSTIDNKFTAFRSDTTKWIVPSQYATGIKSAVKTDGEYLYKDQTVGLDSDYTYHVSFTNNQPAQNIIIYDVLSNSLSGLNYDWNGEFDTLESGSLYSSELVSSNDSTATLDPKIYYCIKSGDLTDADLDITKTDIWVDEEPTDKSTVKAIAVDCRTDTNGNDYSLGADKSITFNIKMRSPKNEDNDIYTYNEAYVSGTIGGDPFNNVTVTGVLLHYVNPEFHKSSFPETGTSSARAGVVNKSTINYNLEVTNPDESVSINNIVVEDLLDKDLKINNMPKVKIGDNDPIAINKTARVSYEITDVTEGTGQDAVTRAKFTATISSLAAGETITIILPATVDADINSEIDNTANITAANGSTFESENYITSETTYHYVTVTQAKIKKVNAKGEGLAGATLEIYDNNSTNFDSSTGKIKSGATPKTVKINGENTTSFTSTNDVVVFNLEPGDYVLHESAVPNINIEGTSTKLYKTAKDIPFTIDIEGITHVNGEAVNYVEMVDQPKYKIIFHENKPGGTQEELTKEFRVFEPTDLTNNKVKHFYDIPEWAGDEYVFAGWYYSTHDNVGKSYRPYTTASNIDSYVNTPADFENETFTGTNSNNSTDNDYHFYAKWIKVDTLDKDTGDNNDVDQYRGFGLVGVQHRDKKMFDSNYNTDKENDNDRTPAGMRYITSLSESLYSQINDLSTQKVNTPEGNVDVEYGFAVGTWKNMATFVDGIDKDITGHYTDVDTSKYSIQYNGTNVNGTDTTGETRSAETDYRYVTNVNCTRGTTNTKGTIKDDHRNYTNYRLYTLVVTYDGADANKTDEKIAARAYIRYYDANGKLRVFYNTYKKATFGACLCSYSQVSSFAIGKKTN